MQFFLVLVDPQAAVAGVTVAARHALIAVDEGLRFSRLRAGAVATTSGSALLTPGPLLAPRLELAHLI